MRERLHVLRHRDFRNLWLGQSASAIGDAVVIVALALYVTELTDDPSDPGSCARHADAQGCPTPL